MGNPSLCFLRRKGGSAGHQVLVGGGDAWGPKRDGGMRFCAIQPGSAGVATKLSRTSWGATGSNAVARLDSSLQDQTVESARNMY